MKKFLKRYESASFLLAKANRCKYKSFLFIKISLPGVGTACDG